MSITSNNSNEPLINGSDNSYAPGIAVCRESISGGAINQQEIRDGTEVTISVAGSGAEPGDVLRVFIDDVLVAEHILDASEISNNTGTTTGTGIARVAISAEVLLALSQGGHTVTSQMAYSDGSQSKVSTAKGLLTIDTVGPDAPVAPIATDDVGQTVGVIAEAATTDDANPLFSGTISAKNNTIEVFDNGVSLGKATVNTATGKWTLAPSTALVDGTHAITVIEYDRAGNPSPMSAAMNFTVDTGAAKVDIGHVIDSVGEIQGMVTTNGVTDDTTATLVGTAKANTVVTISEGATVLGTSIADAVGHWRFKPTGTQAEGTHTYTASISVAGNTITSAEFVLTVDTTGPVVVVTPLGDNLKTAAEATDAAGVLTVTGEVDARSTVTFVGQHGQVVKTITHDGSAKPVLLSAADLVTLGDGAVEVTTVTKDKAGNTTVTPDGVDGDFTLDTAATVAVADVVNTTEDVTSISGNVGTNDTNKDGTEKFSLVGSATGLYGALVLGANGAYTYTRTANLDAIQTTAVDTFTYQVRDGAGNTTQSALKINMAPVNDAAVIGGATTGALTETNAAQSTTGTLTITDVDSPATFAAQNNTLGSNGYGKFSLTTAGVWTYSMNTAHDEFAAGVDYTDSFIATSVDGTTQRVTVTIKGTNEQPTFTSSASIAFSGLEDTAYNFVIADSLVGKVSDLDAAASVKGIAVSWNQASVDQGVWAWSTDGITWTALPADITGTATTFNNTANAVYLNATDRLRFTPAANWSGSVNPLVFRVADDTMPATLSGTRLNVSNYNGTTGAMSLGPSSYTLAVSSVNDAPVVNPLTVIDMTPQLEDAAAPLNGNATAGTLVSSLVGAVSDVDAGAIKGMAVTAISGAGTLYYTLNNGTTWTAINNADIGVGKALLLDGTSRVFFQSSANWNGYNDNVISYRGWDKTNLSSTVKVGDKVDVGVTGDNSGLNGGSSAFSAVQGKVGLTVTAVNDAPVAVNDVASATEASGVGNATMGTNPIGNVLNNDTDVDNAINTLVIKDILKGTTGTATAVTASTTSANGTSIVGMYGTLVIGADGSYTYSVSQTNATVQALNTNSAPLNDVFTYTVKDPSGLTSAATITVSVKGANDAAVIAGTSTATLTETNVAQTAAGTLTVTDVDSPTTFVAQSGVAGSNGYGKFSITAAGVWTYTMNTAHDEFVASQAYTDSITVASSDGTTKLVTVTINGTDDAAYIGGTATANLTETDVAQTATGTLAVLDVDSVANNTFVAQTNMAKTYGSFSVSTAGVWTYTMGNAHNEFVAGVTYTDSITIASATGLSKVVTVTLLGTNDAAVIGGVSTASLTESNVVQTAMGSLTITDADNTAAFVAQSNVAGSNGYGKFSVTAAGVWNYAMNTAHDEFLLGQVYTDSITVAAVDGTTQVITVSITGTNDAPTLSYVDTGVSNTDAITNSAAMTISSLEAAATWDYQVDGGAWVVGMGTAFTMSEGQHTYNVRQHDALNHVSANATKTVTLDTVAPNAAGIALASDSGISNTDGVTNNGTLNVALSSDTNSWQYSTNGGTTWVNGTGTTLGLAAGVYAANSIQVQAFDKAGNVSVSKYASALTVDTSAPTVSVSIGNTGLQFGQSTTVGFNFSEAVYGFANGDVSVSGGSLSNITGSGKSYSATFTAGYAYNTGSYVSVNGNTYTDQAGNNGAAASTGGFRVGPNVADLARGMALYVGYYGHNGLFDPYGYIDIRLSGNSELQGATVTLYDGWGHSWSNAIQGSGGTTDWGQITGTGDNVTRYHADITYAGSTYSVGGGVAYEVTSRGIINLGLFKCIKTDTAYSFCYTSPIVLDLNGDGVQTVDAAHGVQFDMAGDGNHQVMGWVDKHDALLVRDINHDGHINNGTELFGSDTVLKNGEKAGDGWSALAEVDSNGDGKIDVADAAFADINVWVDANGNGITDAGELRGLSEAGIQSINVSHANANTTQNGNVLFGAGHFTKLDGSTAAMTDAWFEVGQTLELDFTQIQGQPVNMTDGKAQAVKLNFQDLLAYSGTHGPLQISGDAADAVQIVNGAGAVVAQSQVINDQVFNAYDINHDGVNDLLILQAMNQAQLF